MSDLRDIDTDLLTNEDFQTVTEFMDDLGNRQFLDYALGVLHWDREQFLKRIKDISDGSLIAQATGMIEYATLLHDVAALVQRAGDRIVLVLRDPQRRSAAGKESSHAR